MTMSDIKYVLKNLPYILLACIAIYIMAVFMLSL